MRRPEAFAPDSDSDGRRIRPLTAVIEIPAKPSFGKNLFRFTGSLPDLGGSEMGPIGVRISYSLDHAETPLAVERPQPGELRMKSCIIADPQDILGRQGDFGTGFVIGVITKGNQRIDTVISSGKLQHHENRSVFPGGHLTGRGGRHGIQTEEGFLQKSGTVEARAPPSMDVLRN